MKKVVIILYIVIIVFFDLCIRQCNKNIHNLNNDIKERERYVGKKVVIGNDTLIVLKFNFSFTSQDSYTLSNNMEVSEKLVRENVLKE